MADLNVANTSPAPVFAALGDATRLRLVSRLSDGRARSISDLTGGLGISRQGITKHLHVLEQAGIVNSDRVGRESQFTYVPSAIENVKTYLETVSEQWDDAIFRLKNFVET